MDGCVLLTSTPSCVVSPRGDPSGCALGIARRGETTHSGVDVNNTHPSMINPLITLHCVYMGLVGCNIFTIEGTTILSYSLQDSGMLRDPPDSCYDTTMAYWVGSLYCCLLEVIDTVKLLTSILTHHWPSHPAITSRHCHLIYSVSYCLH